MDVSGNRRDRRNGEQRRNEVRCMKRVCTNECMLDDEKESEIYTTVFVGRERCV